MTYHKSLNELWHDTVNTLLIGGVEQKSRAGDTVEICPYSVGLSDITQNFVTNVVELLIQAMQPPNSLWYFSGDSSVKMLLPYAPSYSRFAEDDGHAHGAYGPRIIENLPIIIEILRNHPDSRQAVLPIWDLSDPMYAHYKRDIPCTVMLQFLLRRERLNCITYMRSNDVWLGMPYDIFCFTMIQRLVADELGVDYGGYVHHVGSMHLYDKDRADALRAVSYLPDKDHYENHWSDLSLMGMKSAVFGEAEMRKGKNPHLSRFDSPTNDLLICCQNKLFKETTVVQSELLHEAATIRWDYEEKKGKS